MQLSLTSETHVFAVSLLWARGALLLEPLATSAPHGHRVQACHLKSVTFVGLDVRNCAGPGVVDSTPAKISKVLRVRKRLVLIPRRRDAFSLCDHPS